jgi:hypothetical protein
MIDHGSLFLKAIRLVVHYSSQPGFVQNSGGHSYYNPTSGREFPVLRVIAGKGEKRDKNSGRYRAFGPGLIKLRCTAQ